MKKQNLREERLQQETLFQGRMISLERDTVRLPDGKSTTREVVRHPGAVAIIALRGDEVLFVRQYRYAIGQETLEIPAGKLEPGEEPLLCAQRELREETGYKGTMTALGSFYSTPGFTNELMHLFLARDLVWDPLAPDSDEFLTVEAMSWTEALERARSGGFPDAKTVLGLLLVQEKIR